MFYKSRKSYSVEKCGVQDQQLQSQQVTLCKVNEAENGLKEKKCLSIYLGELGDYDPDEHQQGYLEDFRFVPFQNMEFENEVEQYHKQHKYEREQD